MAAGWALVLAQVASFGGTVRFMLTEVDMKGNVAYGDIVPHMNQRFIPLLSSSGLPPVNRFPENLFNETSSTWSFGICQDLDMTMTFRLCYIYKPETENVDDKNQPKLPRVQVHFLLNDNLDLTQDIVTFSVSTHHEPKDRLEGVVNVQLTRPHIGKSWTNSSRVPFPVVMGKSMLYIGFQSALGIPSQFDSFFGTNSTEFSKLADQLINTGRSVASLLCLDLLANGDERCHTTTSVTEKTARTTTDPTQTIPTQAVRVLNQMQLQVTSSHQATVW